MNFTLQGKLIDKKDKESVSDSFTKREFVIEVENERNSDWNDFIKFQLTQDRCSLLDNLSLKDNVRVTFSIRGRRTERDGEVNFFNNLEAWKIEKVVFEKPEAPAKNTDGSPKI